MLQNPPQNNSSLSLASLNIVWFLINLLLILFCLVSINVISTKKFPFISSLNETLWFPPFSILFPNISFLNKFFLIKELILILEFLSVLSSDNSEDFLWVYNFKEEFFSSVLSEKMN